MWLLRHELASLHHCLGLATSLCSPPENGFALSVVRFFSAMLRVLCCRFALGVLVGLVCLLLNMVTTLKR